MSSNNTNNWLNSLQCLGLVENAVIVRDPRKKQKLNAAPASSGSHIAALVYQQATRLL